MNRSDIGRNLYSTSFQNVGIMGTWIGKVGNMYTSEKMNE
jgi:hypothetical protein